MADSHRPPNPLIRLMRANILSMCGYTPGEQPVGGDVIKLNTNENPYPPSPKVFEAIREVMTDDALRKYPDPLGCRFRETAARVLNVDPDAILIGNGSDDILTILTRAFIPENGLMVAPTPSYTLYKTLAQIQGCRYRAFPFRNSWQAAPPAGAANANLVFIPNPNSPTGTMTTNRILASWPGPLVIDEAYIDFADTNSLELIREDAPVIVTRSLSKSYSLAGIRFGFAVGPPSVVSELYKVKDSYNCDALSLAAATAAIEDQAHMLENRNKIIATRTRLTEQLRGLGFEVTDSNANFVWCRHNDCPSKEIYAQLRSRNILVRYMEYEKRINGLRISVGSDEEIDQLLGGIKGCL